MCGSGLTHLAAHLGGLLVRHVMPEPLGEKAARAIGSFPDLIRGERLSGYLLHEGTKTGATGFRYGGELVTDLGGDSDHDVGHTVSIRGVYAPRHAFDPTPPSTSAAIARRTVVRVSPY